MVSGAFKNFLNVCQKVVQAVLQAEGSVHGCTRASLASERMVSGPQGRWWSELTTEQAECRFIRHPFPRRNRKMAEGSSQINFSRLPVSVYDIQLDRSLPSTIHILSFTRKNPARWQT